MIRELSDLGKHLRKEKENDKIIHDALKDEPVTIDLIINEDGSFERFEVIEKIFRPAEAITAKKGKARLLLDKAEEVLIYNSDMKKHSLFIDKLNLYKELFELNPVFNFYDKNKSNGVAKALSSFEEQVGEKERNGNIAFRLKGYDKRIHEEDSVYKSIIKKYEANQSTVMEAGSKSCSICGKNDYPVEDIPHGMIKRVPDGQSSGCALVSYNEKAFESYDLTGNNNSSICTNCARTYVEGLNWLLDNGSIQIIKDSKGNEKKIFKYSNRKNFGSDTAMVFWTKDNKSVSEIDILEEPVPDEVANLIDSVSKGKLSHVETGRFFSCTLSGAAARIAVRDWIEQSLVDLHKSLAVWFDDIVIERFNFDLKRNEIYYPRLYDLARSTQNEKADKDATISRVAVSLWNAALKKSTPQLMLLSSVLKRIRVDEKGITHDRASLIKIILNRNNNKGGFMIKEKLDLENNSTAYICGRIFSVLESIQRAALGKDINAGIRDRFFSSASTNPSSAFGRLMKMSQNHLTKIKGEKPGLAIILDKELQELFFKVNNFPPVFSLEEQGQFAIGYYHQKHYIFTRAAENKELKDAVEIID